MLLWSDAYDLSVDMRAERIVLRCFCVGVLEWSSRVSAAVFFLYVLRCGKYFVILVCLCFVQTVRRVRAEDLASANVAVRREGEMRGGDGADEEMPRSFAIFRNLACSFPANRHLHGLDLRPHCCVLPAFYLLSFA